MAAYWACKTQFAHQSNWFPSPIAGLFSYEVGVIPGRATANVTSFQNIELDLSILVYYRRVNDPAGEQNV